MRTTLLSLIASTFLPALLLTSCAHPAHLTGQPSWLAIGGELYQEHDLPLVDSALLQFDPHPQWFVGLPQQATRAQYETYLARVRQEGGSAKYVPDDAPYFLTTPPPYPNTIHDLPSEDHRVRLHFTVTPTPDPAQLHFTLTLTSPAITADREVEHRSTNALPFLFAIFLDGQPLTRPTTGVGYMGGIHYMIPLASPNHPRQWNLSVDANSLLALLPDRAPHTLILIAAYANSQHRGYLPGDTFHLPLGRPLDRQPSSTPPIALLLRSNPTTLRWTHSHWQLAP